MPPSGGAFSRMPSTRSKSGIFPLFVGSDLAMSNYTSIRDEQFFGALGRLAISWGHIEFGIDAFVALLHWKFGGHQLEKVVPWGLKDKLDYIRKYFRKHYPSYHGTTIVCQLMVEIATASENRHDLIHGFILEQPEGAGEAKLIRLLRVKDGKFREKKIHVTTATVLKHAVDAGNLGSRLSSMVVGLSSVAVEDMTNKPAIPSSALTAIATTA
jgi:hypothetical protein